MSKTITATPQLSACVSSLFKISLVGSAIAALGFSTGCTTTQVPPSNQVVSTSPPSTMLDATSLDSLEDLLSATDMRAVEGDRLLILKHGDVWKRMTVGFKMDTQHWDPRIDAQRNWFISRQPYLDRLSARASRYLYHTVKEAERRGLPTELALLPIIESSYDPAATSSAAAAGMWQFIPSTGRIYGLRQTGMYDGRRDVVESTRAAYEFLGSLYNQFGSWELALAAYNAGPGRIQQAINRNQAAGLPTDYWSLRLPQETMNYVPRFLAVAQIIKEPHKYNVSLPPIANRPHFREVTVLAGVQLNDVANVTGLSRAELYALNPGHRGDMVDASSTLKILIPADLKPTVDTKLRSLSAGSWASVPDQSNASVPAITTTVTQRPSTPVTTTSTVQTPGKSPGTPSNSVQNPSGSTSSVPLTTQATTAATSDAQKLKVTPQGANALAQFAANADVPSAPRIPVAITPAANVKPVIVEPPITAQEREQVLAAIKAQDLKQSPEQILQPQASSAERDEVVKELTALAPQGTEVVDPLDGKIKLTAIQTSQSVATQKGQEVSVGFAYPKSVANNTQSNSSEAKLNRDKSFEQTSDEVVVVAPKGKRSTYTVLAGDTLAIIATKNGVAWRDLAKWNQVSPDGVLYTGTTLYLYDAKPAETKSTQRDQTQKTKTDSKVKTQVYTVQRGEYLKLIADRYALSTQELADLTDGLAANSSLLVGQKINVPVLDSARGGSASSSSNTNSTTNNANSSSNSSSNSSNSSRRPKSNIKTVSYKVQAGESLYSIATKAKISLNELAELNQFAVNSTILVGQTIQIPESAITPESYVVRSGDSLVAVANQFDIPLSRLAALNGLSTQSSIRVGQRLKLKGEVVESKLASNELRGSSNTRNNSKANTSENTQAYAVKSGDTLASIARGAGMTLDDLLSLNQLSLNDTILVGQRLKVVASSANRSAAQDKAEQKKSSQESGSQSATSRSGKTVSSKDTEKYVVKSGESLSSIAGRVGLSVQDLAALNNLNARTSLRVGQSIVIPKLTVQYRVKSGDSLIRLASRYGMDAEALAEMNRMKPNASLKVGEVLQVPNL